MGLYATAQSDTSGRRFLRGRVPLSSALPSATSSSVKTLHPTSALQTAQRTHLEMLRAQSISPLATSLSVPWQPVGPVQVMTGAYGAVTGRVTSIAIDPADASGNTVYVGTTGGGVWKSTHAAGAVADVRFVALTDVLPVFSANAASSVLPSLSIGAVSVQPGGAGVVLAGTGDPNDATDSYYGEGILRSADGGSTWTLAQQSSDVNKGHSFTGESVAAFAWSTLSPDVVVAAVTQSKEGTLAGAGSAGASARGLYYSTDAGATWQMATLMDGAQVVQSASMDLADQGNAATDVVWNAVRQRFYAAVRFHGYYESSDGRTWSRLSAQPGAGLTAANCPVHAGTVGAQSCPLFRGVLAVQPATGDLFALTVDLNEVDQGLWQDVCARSGNGCSNPAVQFSKQWSTAALERGGAVPQGDYNLALAAVPAGSDTLLFAGTTEIFRCSLADGCSFRNTTNATTGCAGGAKVAPAQHAIAWNSAAMYFGNDGGLWRSMDQVTQVGASCGADDAAHFQNLNVGLGSLAEVHAFSSDPSQADTLLAGLGSLGSAGTSSASSLTAWTQLSTGEGAAVAIDAANPENWYVQSGAGVSILGCTKGSACSVTDFTGPPQIGLAQVSGDASLADAPFLLDPALSTNAIVATCRVWRGPVQGGALWSSSNAISAAFAGPTGGTCNGANSFIRSLAAGGELASNASAQNSGSPVIYAGMAGTQDGGGAFGGHLYSTTQAQSVASTTVWDDRTASPVTNDVANNYRFNPQNYDVASIAVDRHDASGMTVYAAVMGFGVPHVYRSVDAGATWTNVSRNLPDAPANAVVVDPNDANTVYVATDAGVYATTQMGACATSDCWSVYGTGLPNAPVVSLEVQAGLKVNGAGDNGVLRAGTYGRGIWQVPLLTAGVPQIPVLTLSPASLSFATQVVHTSSAVQTITVTNTGNAPFVATSVETTGDFSASTTCTAAVVVAYASCTVSVTFTPTGSGTRSGMVLLHGNVAGGNVSALLSGSGSGGILLQPVLLTFPDTAVHSSSAEKTITLSNSGSIGLGLSAFAASGDFSIGANSCGTVLAGQGSCVVSIVFTPITAGARAGVFSVITDAGTVTANLSGSGVAAATDALSTSALSFPATVVGVTSAAQTVTLTNDGDVALTLVRASVIAGDFAVVNGCGTSLLAHSSCSLQVTFTPTSVGTQSGVLQITDALRSQVVTLNGSGVAPAGISLAPSVLNFGTTGVGNASASQSVMLTNNGGSPLQLDSVLVSGEFGIVSGTNTCSTTTTMAAGASCQLQIAFVPQAGGVRSGALQVTSNAATRSLSLSGTGLDFSLAATNGTSQTITSGQSAVYSVLVTPSVALPQGFASVALACAGVPSFAKCTVAPSAVDMGASTLIMVTVLTGTTSTAKYALLPGRGAAALFLLLVPFAWKARRRVPLLALLLSFGLMGCGAGRLLPDNRVGDTGGGGAVRTPSGTYNLTVSGSSAGLTRVATLTLTVQ